MNRSLVIVMGALALCVTLFGGSYLAGQRLCQVCVVEPPGGLGWLQKEFHLSVAETARIQKLHNNYLAQCSVMCRMVADKKQEVATALNGTTSLNPLVEQKLAELADCRAHCESQMLQYFTEVSQNMPPAQGRRYLAEMQKFALGLPEGRQQSVSEPAGR